MALRDLFKKKRKEPKKIKEPEKIELAAKTEEAKPEIKKERKTKPRKKISNLAYRVLASPHITEKAAALADKNQYVFKVFPETNKIEIKRAVEQIYDVNVLSVKIVNIPKKPKRWGRTTGWKKGYKKAIVKLKEGQKIEVIPR